MNACIIPGCTRDGLHTFKLYVRESGSSTGAIIAPTLKARVCPEHLRGGLEMDITVKPKRGGRLDIWTHGERGGQASPRERKTVDIPSG